MRPWLRALEIGLISTAGLGLACVFLPRTMQGAWNLLFFGQTGFGEAGPPAGFTPEAEAYVLFLYGVLGAVLTGFALALLALTHGPLRQGQRWAWNAVTLSIGVWFVLDVAFSLWSGFWPNAMLNLAFGAALFLPLWKLRRFTQ